MSHAVCASSSKKKVPDLSFEEPDVSSPCAALLRHTGGLFVQPHRDELSEQTEPTTHFPV
jgi:hypothetical protein